MTSERIVQRERPQLEGLPLAIASERTIPEYYVDNTFAGFSTTGAWSTGSASGQFGSSHAYRSAAVNLPGEVVLDDGEAGTTFSGAWAPGNNCNVICPPVPSGALSPETPYGATYRHSVTGDPATGDAPAYTWSLTLPGAGQYRVYVRWVLVEGGGAVTYEVTHAGGTSSHAADQSQSSNGWYALGSYAFSTSASITLTGVG